MIPPVKQDNKAVIASMWKKRENIFPITNIFKVKIKVVKELVSSVLVVVEHPVCSLADPDKHHL